MTHSAPHHMISTEMDEPLSPAGRLFVRPETNQIINCVLGGEASFDIEKTKDAISNSVMLKQPRFNSLLVVDSRGREYWRRTKVNVDNHLIVRHQPLTGDPNLSDEDAVNGYLADLSVSCPLSIEKPLWEVHLLMAHKCLILRLHHALGDGISLMSMFMTLCRETDDPSTVPTIGGHGGAPSTSNLQQRWRRNLGRILKVVFYTFLFALQFIMRTFWVKDKKTAVSGGAGVELWPRKLATAKFNLEHMKTVKKALVNATINDVLFGVISCGLSRYLDIRSPKVIQEGIQMTGVSMVNLRQHNGPPDFLKLSNNENGSRFGNQIGIILLPVYYHKADADPLQCVRRAKAMIDKRKLSLEAPFSYRIGQLVMFLFGSKMASLLNYRILCNTTFTISNVIGPRKETTFIGIPMTYLRVNSTGLPHAITMHMVSYAGRADMQILVAKDIIPDPKLLAKCFEDSLYDMKIAAELQLSK